MGLSNFRQQSGVIMKGENTVGNRNRVNTVHLFPQATGLKNKVGAQKDWGKAI